VSTPPRPILVATDLTDDAAPALRRGLGHARSTGAPLVVCHVVPDVRRHHPLSPTRDENDLMLGAGLTKRAAELVSEQVGRVLQISADEYRVVIETGTAEDEIVRVSEAEAAALLVIGAKLREGGQKIFGHVAERVVRYAHGSVLVARPGKATGKVLVPTDFGAGALPAMRLAKEIVRDVGVEVTLLHVLEIPSSAMPTALAPFGAGWTPPPQAVFDELKTLGGNTLSGLVKEYGFAHAEQVEGAPADVIVERAHSLDVEMIIMGSRGRTGLRRLVLGSVAEKVIRRSDCSVLVAR
jgi:universal stress protein E